MANQRRLSEIVEHSELRAERAPLRALPAHRLGQPARSAHRSGRHAHCDDAICDEPCCRCRRRHRATGRCGRCNVANVARVTSSRAFSHFTAETGYIRHIGYETVDQGCSWMVCAPTGRRQPRSRLIARRVGSPCPLATFKGSVRLEHVMVPVLVASAEIIYVLCIL